MPTIGEALRQARAALKQALTLDDREAGLEAHVLLGHALGLSRAQLIARREVPLQDDQLIAFQALLDRRRRGEPVAYLTGEREFFGLNLRVTPAVLIPRPDTELLVESALAHLPEGAASAVLDLGTGSGAVALAIAANRPDARVTAVDRSAAALAVAAENARRLGAANVTLLQGDWFSPLPPGQRFDLIVGNPPYVAVGDPHLERGDLRFEPRAALVAGADGLEAIRAIVLAAPGHLKPGGWLALEHGFDQGNACRAVFSSRGFQRVATRRDLADRERVTEGFWPQRAT